MKNLNVAVIFYSATGTNYEMAKLASESAKNLAAGEVRLRKIKELAPEAAISENEEWKKNVEAMKDVETVTLDDLEWADAIVFSMPTRYGNVPSQVQQFFDTTGGLWFSGKLANKVVTGMTSASNDHGGQESTLLSLYKTMAHWGAIVAAPGYTDKSIFEAGGNPYGMSVTAGNGQLNDSIKKALEHQVKRTLTIASWVKKGLEG